MHLFDDDIHHCLQVLSQGGIILYPTDTIWGLGCDATNEQAVKKIYEIKRRQAEKSMIVLVAGQKDILRYVASPDPAVFNFIRSTTRPTTIIYDGAIGLAQNLIGPDGSIAIRVVNEQFCRHLLTRFRKPIVSTSANLSGMPAPRHFGEITGDIRNAVDYIVAYRQDDQHDAEPSSVVRWNRDGSKTILR